MSLWEVQRRHRIRVYGAERVRQRLASGRLDGDSLVRRLGEAEWRRLREVPELIRSPLPHAHASRSRSGPLVGLAWHAAIWAGLSWRVHLPLWVVLPWGFAVCLHALRVVRGFLARRPGQARATGETTPAADRVGAAEPEADAFLAELGVMLDDLERTAAALRLAGVPDLPALRAATLELRRRHLALVAFSGPVERTRLEEERDRALSQASRSTDPRTVEALKAQARSVNERLESLREAAEAAARLEARERTLLHQVEALRLGLARYGADEAPAPDLAGEVQRLELDLKSSAEIEAHLARARLEARQPADG